MLDAIATGNQCVWDYAIVVHNIIDTESFSDDFETVKRIPNNQIIPLCQFGKACFYTVKNQDYLYVSYRKNDSPYFDESTIKNFKRQFGILMEYYIENKKIYYSDYDLTL